MEILKKMHIEYQQTIVLKVESQLGLEAFEGKPTFAYEVRQLRQQIRTACQLGNEQRVAELKPKLGGISKNYHHFLIKLLTDFAFAKCDNKSLMAGRLFVQKWQKETFGKSIAAKELAEYAHADKLAAIRRGCKGLIRKFEPTADMTNFCRDFYWSEKNAITESREQIQFKLTDDRFAKIIGHYEEVELEDLLLPVPPATSSGKTPASPKGKTL